MKRALIHIGPHKTGSTYIQQMMKVNADLFPESHAAHLKSDPLFSTLQSLAINIRTHADLAQRLPAIQDTSAQIARGLNAENTLFSSEDLLGPVPTLAGVSGLYPFVDQTLPAIQSAFLAAGVEVQFFCYIREYDDWLRSVHAHRFRGRERPFAPRKFKTRSALPNDWADFIARLRASLGPANVANLSYETDAASGRMGSALFRVFGLSEGVLNQMDWIAPVNVSPRSP
jgi:hypothetical protein